MPRKRFIDEDTKRFVRETFEWIKSSGIEYGYFSRKWKDDLIDKIYTEFLNIGEEVKKASIRRNVNRMISFYYNTGAQARSGKKYLTFMEKFFNNIVIALELADCKLAAYFLTTAEARAYRGEISVLVDVPHFPSRTIAVYRCPS